MLWKLSRILRTTKSPSYTKPANRLRLVLPPCLKRITTLVYILGEQLQLNPTPFELLECADASKQLPLEKLGRFRWVSTSIVRFDPATDWPPDLCFKLVIKSTLKTHDGLRLTGSYSAGYQTSPLTMYAGEVRSKMALAVTGGRWESHTDKGGYNECPMDGIVHLKFSHPVIPSRVLTALTLDKGAGLRDWFNKKGAYFDDWVGSCSGSQEQEETNAADTDTPLKCVSVKPRNLRSDGTLYNLKLPRSSRVSFLGGSTQKEQTVRLMGALPFKFRFKQETMPNIVTTLAYNSYKEKRPRFRRYALYLRHGLQILVDAANANKVRLWWRLAFVSCSLMVHPHLYQKQSSGSVFGGSLAAQGQHAINRCPN